MLDLPSKVHVHLTAHIGYLVLVKIGCCPREVDLFTRNLVLENVEFVVGECCVHVELVYLELSIACTYATHGFLMVDVVDLPAFENLVATALDKCGSIAFDAFGTVQPGYDTGVRGKRWLRREVAEMDNGCTAEVCVDLAKDFLLVHFIACDTRKD